MRGKKTTSALERLPPPGGVITRVDPARRSPGSVVIRVGRRACAPVPADVAASLGARVGAQWTDELRQNIAKAIERTKARAYAINAATSRPISGKQLEMKLLRRGTEKSAAGQIVEELKDRGVLDDAAFARAAASSELARKPAGKSLLLNKLRAKGIDAKVATAAVNQAIEDSNFTPLEGATKFAQRKMRSLARLEPAVAQRRLYAALARRGFDAQTCGQVVRAMLTGRAVETDDRDSLRYQQ